MTSMWYAMREALALVAEEGLPAMWERHTAVSWEAQMAERAGQRERCCGGCSGCPRCC